MKPADQLLRENVRALQGKRTQRSLAKAIGVSDTNMSEFLAGHQGLGLERLAPLAKELGTTVAGLFAPVMPVTQSDVHETKDVTSLVQTPGLESASQNATGDTSNGAEVGSLRAENNELRRRLAEYVTALRVATDGIARLAHGHDAPGQLQAAGSRKPKRR